MQLAETGNSLSPDQIEAVVKRVNTLILRERRASREVTRKVRVAVYVHACSGTLIIRQQMGDQCHIRLHGCRIVEVLWYGLKITSNSSLKLVAEGGC